MAFEHDLDFVQQEAEFVTVMVSGRR